MTKKHNVSTKETRFNLSVLLGTNRESLHGMTKEQVCKFVEDNSDMTVGIDGDCTAGTVRTYAKVAGIRLSRSPIATGNKRKKGAPTRDQVRVIARMLRDVMLAMEVVLDDRCYGEDIVRLKDIMQGGSVSEKTVSELE